LSIGLYGVGIDDTVERIDQDYRHAWVKRKQMSVGMEGITKTQSINEDNKATSQEIRNSSKNS
jgi:hypothetical protein